VAFSPDVASASVFVIVVVAISLLGTTMFSLLRELWLHATSTELLTRPDDRFPELLLHTARALLWSVLPVMGLAGLSGIAGSFFQVGGVAAWGRLKPDVNRLNPAQGLKRVCSTRNLIGLLKMLLKTGLLIALVWLMIRGLLDTAVGLGRLGPPQIMAVGARSLLMIFAWAAVIYVLLAGIDYAHVHYEFIKGQRMSIDEVRRDYKEGEGDPTTRARRRGTYFETVYVGLADRVAASSAVIYSRRVAVALQYLGDRDLPRVVARGENEMAIQIRRFADDALVPTAFDAALAEHIHADVPLDRAIPRTLYAPVAKLLRWAQGVD
jgi:type III secretion protein U